MDSGAELDRARMRLLLSSVLVGLDTLRRTGADLVLAHGNASTIHVAKVLSMLAFEMPRSETEVASYMTPIIDGRAPRKGSSKPASIPDIRLPLVALPTLPCGGVESSPVVALSDYDKERRLVLSAPELTPTHVLVDPEAIALDVTEAETESKTGIFDARLLHFMAGREFACALESSAAGSSDSLAYLQDAVSAWNEEDAAQIADVLCAQSIRMGKVFKSAQPIAPHEILAAALRDIAPISFEEACGSLLEPSLRLLSEAHEGQPMAAEVGDIISSLPKPQGLLAQGVIFDKEEHLKAAAQAVDAATKGRLHCDRVLRVYEDAL
ncbi:Aldehyde-alcohol dehydrogenase [Hondaea fermentalgiana]|uniref:Aldehyde-alcohol dehydrogenase n=1 Tax=Hondaea fermentalgiana TaxID=2315210 RepID=A0A2R5G4C5_9STRA|nr:Aldehyde-alcohol dehydrogenase [Hondaea fermentalgiana]|eukprot:GBG25850.1 Aldehyde-alcohol dehydrogenase [Hondaea fermentalgiana]